jgi:hypothetical protein
MFRTEIYANRSVEEDIVEELEKRVPDINYTLIEDVKGRGRSGVRHGTAIWPELSVMYIIYGSRAEALLVKDAIGVVKKAFPREGIKMFQYEVKILAEE